MSTSPADAFDIHSESVLTIRRTVIVMSVLLLSLDYRYFSLPESLWVFQVEIKHVTSWHLYATTIVLLIYLLIKYLAKLREIYSKSFGNEIPSANYWIESEKSHWKRYFNSQLLSYLDRKQLGLNLENGPKAFAKNNNIDEIQRIEIKKGSNFQALKGGAYYAYANGMIHYIKKGSPDHIIEQLQWSSMIGPVYVNVWRRYMMSAKAWFWYIFSDHFVIDYFPIIIVLGALAKFVWLFHCRA